MELEWSQPQPHSQFIPPKSGMWWQENPCQGDCVDTVPMGDQPGIPTQCQVFAFVTARRHRES